MQTKLVRTTWISFLILFCILVFIHLGLDIYQNGLGDRP